MSTVAVADDDREMRAWLAEELRRAGHEVVECASGIELLEALGNDLCGATRWVDLAVTDHLMPGFRGLDIVAFLRARHPMLPVLIVTAFPSDDLRSATDALGVHVLSKPFEPAALRSVVARLLAGPPAGAPR